jgi:hypothetical protein
MAPWFLLRPLSSSFFGSGCVHALEDELLWPGLFKVKLILLPIMFT